MNLDFSALSQNSKPLKPRENAKPKSWGEYAENRDKANAYIAGLLKGTRAGEPMAQLFLKACQCIAEMTGENVFYEQIEADVRTIYGEALGDMGALEDGLKAVEQRLERLNQACKRDGLSTDEKKRIESAIKAHKAKLEDLNSLKNESSEK